MKRKGWSAQTIAIVLYPFAAGAMAVNVFFASLIGSWIGLPILSIWWSAIVGAIVGAPASFAFALHIRTLMGTADR